MPNKKCIYLSFLFFLFFFTFLIVLLKKNSFSLDMVSIVAKITKFE